MVSFEIFVKALPPSLSELKVLPSFCFAFKIPDDVAASTMYIIYFFTINHEIDTIHLSWLGTYIVNLLRITFFSHIESIYLLTLESYKHLLLKKNTI